MQLIKLVLAETDPEAEQQAALDIQPILQSTCANGHADKKKIWDALTEDEQANFKALLAPSLEQQPVPEPYAPDLETAPTQEAGEPEPAQIQMPAPETITPEDAEKMRDIATAWWDEYYPDDPTKLEQWQSLISQMFPWKAPGTRYSRGAIKLWLEGEDGVVRDRLDELWQMKHGEGLTESPDCGF